MSSAANDAAAAADASGKASAGGADISSTIQMVKDYARQETIGPLRGAGRWIAFGLAGALTFAVATVFLALGVLRLLQTEAAGTFHGRWMSLIPYLAALVVGLAVIAATLLAMRRETLQPRRASTKEQH